MLDCVGMDVGGGEFVTVGVAEGGSVGGGVGKGVMAVGRAAGIAGAFGFGAVKKGVKMSLPKVKSSS